MFKYKTKEHNSMKLLLIDDDLECIQYLKEALELGGNECILFQNPKEGVAAYDGKNFDAIITDFKMPQMNGIDVLKAVREKNPSAYVIILTGYADLDNAMAALNYGAYAFFRKPLNLKDLIKILSKIEDEINEYKKIKRNFDELHNTIDRVIPNIKNTNKDDSEKSND